MDEKLKTAYHEAGHCFRAWCLYSPAVRSVCLNQVGDDWEGDTNIKRSWFPVDCFLPVALAGFLAEAKAMASEDGPIRQLAATDQLADRLQEILEDELPNAANDVWEVRVSFTAGEPTTSNVTRGDLELIPEAYRGLGHLSAALLENCQFLNRTEHWEVIQELALELAKLAPKCFGQFRIFNIVHESTEAALEVDD